MKSGIKFITAFTFFLGGELSPVQAQTPTYYDPEWRITAPSLAGLPRLRFLTSLDFPPFNFADANKKPTGFNVDLARAICIELKISAKCEIQALPWADLEPALEARRGEAIIAGTAITAEKRATYNLSHSYFKFPARFIANKSAEELSGKSFVSSLKGKKIAAVANSAHAAMLKANFKDVEIVPMGGIQDVYSAVKSSEVDLAFVDGVSASFWLSSTKAENCCTYLSGPYYSEYYFGIGMAVVTRKQDVDLSVAIDSAMKNLEQTGKYKEIYQRYFPISPHGQNF
ncbi:transporter substrate-binding domain-containing protein [Ahrensia kielensis]|uniref:Transporter substrate-binding domain-containing protein n=1 Tax=Ahrensia kielensis TaxID=76980 RepID=A0ABU9T2S2_9HYPH